MHKDRTVSLDGTVYEVDAVLVGQTVTLRHDPGAPPGRPVQVWHQDEPRGLAKPVDLYANCFVKRQRPSHTPVTETPPEPPAPGLSLRDLNNTDNSEDER